MRKQVTDIVIIGAGPSGMVAAGYLEQRNVSIKVFEKQSFPRFTIGESLIPQCMGNFEEAGLLEAIRKQGYQKKYGARFLKKNEVAEFDFSKKYGEGWDWTWQVPRADFDKALSDEIQSRGVDIEFNTEVLSAAYKTDHWEIEVKNVKGQAQSISARFIIDASGNGRVMARLMNLNAPPKIHEHSSIFTHIKEKKRPKGKEGELISFEVLDTQTWFWYIPFSNGNSSLGFVANNKWFEKFPAGSNTEVFLEMLKTIDHYEGRFNKDDLLFEPVKMKNISKGVKSLYGKGFLLTGNSAEFLDPVFSSGVAFAAETGLLGAKLAYRDIKGEKIDWETEYAEHIQKGVDVFSTYIKEWYSGRLQRIFFHPQPNENIKEQICAVLAGYVWDNTNPFVRNHDKIIESLDRLIQTENY